MHSPHPFSWDAQAASASFQTTSHSLDESFVHDTFAHDSSSNRGSYAGGSAAGLLSPVDEDVWLTFHFPSSPRTQDNSYHDQPGAQPAEHESTSTSSTPFTFPALLSSAGTPLSSSSPPHLTPAIRHLRLQSKLPIFPSLSAQPSSTDSLSSTPQRSSPGSPTVAAFLANPKLLPKLLGRKKHQQLQVSRLHTTIMSQLFAGGFPLSPLLICFPYLSFVVPLVELSQLVGSTLVAASRGHQRRASGGEAVAHYQPLISISIIHSFNLRLTQLVVTVLALVSFTISLLSACYHTQQ